MVIAIREGERPKKPENAEALGFSDTLWQMVRMCWNESPSARPAARELLHYLENDSNAWVPPPEYPISSGLDGGAWSDSTSGDERRAAVGSLTTRSSLFVLMMVMLCVSLLPLT